MGQNESPVSNRIPSHWDEITPQWVTCAIADQYPSAVVSAVDILMRDDGTNRRLRLGLSYARGTGPATLFLKANEPEHRSVHLRNGNLFNEAQLFSSAVPLFVDHPRVYESLADREGGNFLLVMEDLASRNADPRDATRPLSVEQVASGLRGLARMHRHYWGFTERSHPSLAWVQTWEPTEGWQVGLRKRIPIGLQRSIGVIPPTIAAYGGDDVVGLWARYVGSLRQGTMTLLHGDAHIGNTYVLPDNSVGFLDWQVVRRGEWSQDVGYFLVGSLTEDDRRRSERDLLEEYRQALDLPAAERPSHNDMWLRYRAAPAYGLAVWLSTLGTDGYQSREVSLSLVQRFSRAFVELDTCTALNGIAPRAHVRAVPAAVLKTSDA